MNPQARRILWVAILASFIAFLDGSIVNVALPAITADLEGGLALQQWVVDAYLLTLGSLILVAGSLSDNFGRVRILRLGVIGFGLASLLCAVAPTGGVLIAARGFQGVAGALLIPSSLALITSHFDGPAQSKAIGTWTAWTGTSFLAGPLLGGVLVDAFSWRWIFAVNVVPVVVTLWLIARLHDVEEPRVDRHVDYVGATLAVVGLGGPVFALIEQTRWGWTHPGVWIPMGVGLVSFAAFLRWEHRTPHPMMPLGIFKARSFLIGNIATIGIYGGLSLGVFALTLFLQEVAGFSATKTGLATIPLTVMTIVFSGLFGGLAGRLGARWFMAAGPIVCGLGFLQLTAAADPVSVWTDIVPGVLIFGFGLAVTVAPLTASVLGSISAEQAGIGSAINNAVSRVAGLIMIALAGVIAGSSLDYDSFDRVIYVAAGLLIAGGVIAGIGVQNPPTHTPS
ncbi:MFS transporter [soil metagenome]